jgi:DNA-binding GntR family transcriptional regulator
MPNDDELQALANAALQIFEEWRGSRRALSRKDLCHRLGCDDRILRQAVRELRCQGHLIVADPNGGYRFAQCGEEVFGYTSSLKSRIQALREVTEAMEAQARQRFGEPVEQLSLI